MLGQKPEKWPLTDRINDTSQAMLPGGAVSALSSNLPVHLEFTLRNHPGMVDVIVEANLQPEALGSSADAKDFPVCTAVVDYAGNGYLRAMGWIQLVCSSDNSSGGAGFEMDPYEPLGQLTHPFCWFGFAPMLFDAPSRSSRQDLDWVAHSFLGFVSDMEQPRICAATGFSWGFRIRSGKIVIAGPKVLSPSSWDKHLALLDREHPTWHFKSGFRNN